jgi:cell division septal protein FtsQ
MESKRKQKKGNFFQKLLFKVLFLAFFGVVLWVLFFSNFTEINTFEVETDNLDKNVVRDIFNEMKEGNWLKYGPKNNFFLFPRQKMKEKLKDKFKIIRDIEFENKFPNIIRINIKERKDLLIWCSREKCFLIDETGTAFYELQENEKENRFQDYKIILDKSFSEVETGQKIEEGQIVLFVGDLGREIEEETELKIEREMETPSIISKEIRLKTGKGWQIYFSLEGNIEEQVELLKQILETGISSDEKANLNYIDLRIKGKAIYNSSTSQD